MFDRGYGTMRFISKATEKKYNISTIATTVGSGHPFLTKKELDKFMEDCKSRVDSSTEMEEKWKLYQYWIGDANEIFRSRTRIAKNKINDNQTVYTFTMNELFDPSSDEKLLKFFSTGDR